MLDFARTWRFTASNLKVLKSIQKPRCPAPLPSKLSKPSRQTSARNVRRSQSHLAGQSHRRHHSCGALLRLSHLLPALLPGPVAACPPSRPHHRQVRHRSPAFPTNSSASAPTNRPHRSSPAGGSPPRPTAATPTPPSSSSPAATAPSPTPSRSPRHPPHPRHQRLRLRLPWLRPKRRPHPNQQNMTAGRRLRLAVPHHLPPSPHARSFSTAPASAPRSPPSSPPTRPSQP